MADGSSPHTRGARLHDLVGDPGVRIIPAYAGSTPPPGEWTQGKSDHPRIRGEHRLFTEYERRGGGSSPHTRGALQPRMRASGPSRIIPAYAGSTTEYWCLGYAKYGSSPHTRGAPDATYPFGLWYPDHPRIRGEHVTTFSAIDSPPGSSPHTRGAPPNIATSSDGRRIIPAYAGSTAAGGRWCYRRGDHPRIRGEHVRVGAAAGTGSGSSPHTRGAPTRTRC